MDILFSQQVSVWCASLFASQEEISMARKVGRLIESPQSGVRMHTRRVCRWRDAAMVERDSSH